MPRNEKDVHELVGIVRRQHSLLVAGKLSINAKDLREENHVMLLDEGEPEVVIPLNRRGRYIGVKRCDGSNLRVLRDSLSPPIYTRHLTARDALLLAKYGYRPDLD